MPTLHGARRDDRDAITSNIINTAKAHGYKNSKDLSKLDHNLSQLKKHTYQLIELGLVVVLTSMIILWQLTR